MPSNPNDDSELLPASRIVSELAHLRQYPAHDLVAWQPQDVLDDQLLDAVGTYGKPETYSATVGYLARLRPGVSLSLGFNYTANPSQAFYFGPSKANPSQRFEGNALNFQATLFTTF
jgi:hypothetical protein